MENLDSFFIIYLFAEDLLQFPTLCYTWKVAKVRFVKAKALQTLCTREQKDAGENLTNMYCISC